MKIILGSSSPRRQKILKEMGLDFEIAHPNLDEKSILTEIPRERPKVLAKLKNEALAHKFKDAIIITADTVVIHEGHLREKPQSEEELYHFLRTYWQSPTEVLTAVAVSNTANGKFAEGVESAQLYFHKFPDRVIDELVLHSPLMDAAGGFIADMPLIRKHIVHIEGSMDTVMGLPGELTKKLIEAVSV